jgi:hypothetical protein
MNGKTLATITSAVARHIDRSVDGEPAFRPRPASATLMRELAELRLHRAASLLQREISADLHEAPLADELIGALMDGDTSHASWQELARKLETDAGSAASHPLGLLAQRIRTKDLGRDARNCLARDGWTTFLTAARDNNATVRINGLGIAKLYEVAAVMLPAGAIGTAALQLSFFVADDVTRATEWWWVSLLQAMHDWKRHECVPSADDRVSAAVALLFAYLEGPAQQALSDALRLVPRAAATASEFGRDRHE